MQNDRRTFLKLSAASLAALPLSLQKVLATPASGRTGTIQDVEHVVILMQENRSFDHYFGTLSGVRGFSDPRAITLPGGNPVWQQPKTLGDAETVTPFHLDTATTFAQGMNSLDHSWKKSFTLWKHHDAWATVKGSMTMGYFTRADIPFYYALADAFTIGDAYHCSIFGPTNPNRLFLFTGTSGLSVGNTANEVISNPVVERNDTADIANDVKAYEALTWTTYAERLQAAGINWRVYQEYDNYGDNALAYFANFRGGVPHSPLHDRARSWSDGSNAQNAKTSRGEHLVAAFADDVKNDRLPQVSWIVAPYILCEHPTATPGYGESFVSRLLDALASNPDVFAKTAFILNYDENDGFFDHMPPLVPAIHPSIGLSTADTQAENYLWEPVGFGPRVPLIVVSPWTRGGFVNSELFDHTSVIRFLEKRFGVMEPNISPWRRAVSGDLTSMFDFSQYQAWTPMHDGDGIARADSQAALPAATRPIRSPVARQEPGQRPTRPLPYNFEATVDGTTLTFRNTGATGAGFIVYSAAPGEGPWFYMVDSGKTLSQALAIGSEFDLSVHGSNGYYRRFVSGAIGATIRRDGDDAILSLANAGATVQMQLRDGHSTKVTSIHVAQNATIDHRFNIAATDHWYDISVTDPARSRRPPLQLAGHFETGKPSKTDPAIGRA